MTERADLDVVVWGCTGFTGTLVTAYLAGQASKFHSFALRAPAAPRGLRWAMAGRNRAKIEAVRRDCGVGPEVETIVAAADDVEAIAAFVRRARVVLAVAGPFVLFRCAAARMPPRARAHAAAATTWLRRAPRRARTTWILPASRSGRAR